MANTVRYIGAVVVALSSWLSPAWTMGTRAAQEPAPPPAGQPATPQEPAPPQAEQPAAFAGSDLFRTYCVTCHGQGGKGDGPLAEMLKKRPADLTTFARSNNGVFPAELVGRIIDGRKPVAGHGGKDMPVWGDAFKEAAGGSGEAAIKARIDALVRHVESLQQK